MSESRLQVRAKCPRCGTKFSAEIGPDGFFLCPGCGARLRHRRPDSATGSAQRITDRLMAAVAAASAERARAPDATVAPSTPLDSRGAPVPAPPDRTKPSSPAPARTEPPPDPAPEPPPAAAEPATAPASRRSLEELMLELHRTQKRILEILESRLPAPGASPPAEPPGPQQERAHETELTAHPPAPTRARKRKSVLLIDDDDETRAAAQSALAEADVPVRIATSGRQALELLAAERPDVIALEGELGGEIPGRDLVDRIMSAMEWVDIPIVLYTRARLESADEARTTYGADAYVLKGPQGATALVSQVITAFRKG